jgi:hypothetical protein
VRGTLYEIVSVGLMIASLFFFWVCTTFLGEKNYLGGTLTLFIGFTIVRVGVEMARLAVVLRKEE